MLQSITVQRSLFSFNHNNLSLKWHEEGFPEHIECSNITDSEIYDYFDMDKIVWLPFDGSWITEPFCPMFEKRTFQDEGERLTIQDRDGILEKIKKKIQTHPCRYS